MTIQLTIDGDPVPAARPRVTRWGTYTPPKYKKYKDYVSLSYKNKFHDNRYFEKGRPIKISIEFFRPIQKSVSKKEYARRLKNTVRPIMKPDIDNYIKAILDGLNGLAWCDDSQIVSIESSKYYSNFPRVEIEISDLKTKADD
ncbi:RusA family crossover junction endodeoxyribonuclease [Companilactobacillus mishanensis]|uniref:RusA family crossover junction endodeoxyribonuclease n=1 Tax=Companilactobacillus mishanensis TaxID=2486008 RepID=A0A5P0ZF06_9LACO|nr:RusA family crossover junction endodeoxyribonuclease [Companilactobacillus mishanensis]MQS44267.1 RusA family crossover junction endodeoxyribonuclease [Companilactobacillus mishanensis]MQS51630.1 RusA family crossover junction endodeoxyribonuclease [Companilactobacillus mishanensis]